MSLVNVIKAVSEKIVKMSKIIDIIWTIVYYNKKVAVTPQACTKELFIFELSCSHAP